MRLKRRPAYMCACGLGIALCAATLAGCDYAGRRIGSLERPGLSAPRTKVPLPSPALLATQPEPDCEFPTTETDADERQKLDYERQCYRHAEMIARARLRALQRSVARTIRAVKSCDGCAVQSAALVVVTE
jgi:hypothetical protein